MKIDDDILIDYLFNLTDASTTKAVKAKLKKSPLLRKRLAELKNTFNKLSHAAPPVGRRNYLAIASLVAAAVILTFFISPEKLQQSNSGTAMNIPTDECQFKITSRDHFSKMPQTYTLMTELPSPVYPENTFKIPKARIFYDGEIDSSNTSLNLCDIDKENHELPLDFYCTLKLTN